MPRKIEISHRTIIFAVLFLIGIWLLYFIRDVIFQFFVALIIMAILNPFVTKLSRFRIPRSISVIITYLAALAIVTTALSGVIPALIEQTSAFVNNLPVYVTNLKINSLITDQIQSQILSQISSLPGEVARLVLSLFTNILSVLLVLAFAFYLLMARDKLDDQLSFFFGDEKKREIAKLIDALELRLGGWARGELTLMTLIGVANFAGLALLGIPYALPLAILAGLLEIVPYLGPIVAGGIATVIGLGISPVMGLAVALLASLIQQVENYIFVPKIMERSVGVNPIVTLLALTIGFRLMGIAGALISVPAVIMLQVVASQHLVKD